MARLRNGTLRGQKSEKNQKKLLNYDEHEGKEEKTSKKQREIKKVAESYLCGHIWIAFQKPNKVGFNTHCLIHISFLVWNSREKHGS